MSDTILLDLDVDSIVEYEESDDPQRRTHIVNPPKNLHIWEPGMSSQEIVTIARATGQEVVALCDYRWVPKHNPEKFDVCEVCMSIAHELMQGAGE